MLSKLLKDSSIQDKVLTARQLLINHYKRNLYSFAQNALGYKDLSLNTHASIVKSLIAPTKRKLIVVPRGCFKSTISSVAYPLWLLLNNPNLRIMIDTETYTLSTNILREIKGHLESDQFKILFGDWKGSVWNESEIIIKRRDKVLKESSIKAAAIESTAVGQHFDVIIHDDLCSDNNMQTEDSRQKVIRHYQMNTSILEPNGIVVVIGTRYHEEDIIGHIIQNELDLTSDKINQLK